MNKCRQVTIQPNLILRAQLIRAVRGFFEASGYLEVETPVRLLAPAPEVHIEAFPTGEAFLQTSPELFMKRLLAAGCTRIFQICSCFRKGERGRRHLPAFTMLEWYTTGADYREMMRQTEELILFVSRRLNAGHRIRYQGNVIDLHPPWPRLTVSEAFARYAGCSVDEALLADRFEEVLVTDIEPRLPANTPVFLCDYPASQAALARIQDGPPRAAERFELYIGGLELCNAFSELRDPVEQRSRFEQENARRVSEGKVGYPVPERFLDSLGKMPDATGNALGLDRLAMLFADTDCIDDVVAFVPEDGE